MHDRTNATSTTAGILRPDELAAYATVERLPCSAALAPWVENHWLLRWELPEGARHVSSTVPHPVCTLSVELGHPREGVGTDRVVVTGLTTTRFDVTTVGSGWVLGVKFRPGGLTALAGLDATGLTDRTVPAADLLPPSTVEPLRELTPDLPSQEAVSRVDAALELLLPVEPDPAYETLLRVVEDMLGDRSLVRVAQVIERHGLSRRQVERLFARYVGVGPKWLLARYRLHDVLTDLDAGYDGPLADLAARHGWYDQAHFSRDFVAHVGVPPSEYRRG